jgi:hypothetical protein
MTLILVVSGCSTYAHYDYYESVTGASNQTLSANRFAFSPLRGFASLGPLGVPAIPVEVPGSNETLALEVHIERHNNMPFSVSEKPCIGLENGQQICANKYEISGFVESEKLKWPNNRKHISYGPHEISGRHSRIFSSQIFEQVGFVFTSEWNWLVLTIRYEFQCNRVCPSTFTLDSSDLLKINGTSQFNEKVKYARKTKKDYRPLANPTN